MAPTKRRSSNDMSSRPQRQGKRFKNGAEEPSTDPAEQLSALKAYMHHALKLLHKAVKKSKTFELQKLTRKLKQARDSQGEPKVIADLEAQLVALKAIAIDPMANHLLHTRLPKLSSRALSEHLSALLSSLPPHVQPSTTEMDPTSAPGKARNRVSANKVVHQEWDEITRAIRRRLGEEVPPRPVVVATSASVKGKERAANDEGAATSTLTTPTPSTGEVVGEKRLSKRAERKLKGELRAKQPREMTINPDRLKAMQDVSDEEDDVGANSDASEVDDDEEIRNELEALGGDGGSDWSGSEEDPDSGGDDEDQEDEDDDDDASVASDSSFPLASAPTPTKAVKAPSAQPEKRKKEAKNKIVSSAFLPTLASGYVSYSDSDGEDARWVKDAEKSERKEEKRKNRRGQRARQAIWEKKYGSGANHIVKEIGGAPAPQKGGKASSKKAVTKAALEASTRAYDPSKAPDASKNPNAEPVGHRKLVRPTISYAKSTPIVPIEVAKLSTADNNRAKARIPAASVHQGKSLVEEGMHPSWEAKRRAQEALLNLANAPKGKKITFD